MHVWIDVDNPKHVPLVAQVIKELKERGHAVTLTAPRSKEIKKGLEAHELKARFIGFVFSFLGLFLHYSTLLRVASLVNYFENNKPDIGFSNGSKSMLYFSAAINFPHVFYIENIKHKLDKLLLSFQKSFFIISEDMPDQNLIGMGLDLNKVSKIKVTTKEDRTKLDEKLIKEIANKVEFFNYHLAEILKG